MTASSGDLFINDFRSLSFTGNASGVSPLVVNGTTSLVESFSSQGVQLSVDLSGFVGTGPITLIKGNQPANGVFRNLPESSIVPGTDGRSITYSGGDGFDIVLIPEPSTMSLFLITILFAQVNRRRR